MSQEFRDLNPIQAHVPVVQAEAIPFTVHLQEEVTADAEESSNLKKFTANGKPLAVFIFNC